MKTLLVTGISGFLGWQVTQYKQNNWNIIGIVYNNSISLQGITTIQYDLSQDFNSFKKIVLDIKPNAILHLAAYSRPNDCEKEPKISRKINKVQQLYRQKNNTTMTKL